MTEEKNKTRCPTCEHELSWAFSYPLIQIKNVERLALPEHSRGRLIGEELSMAPKGVRKIFSRKSPSEILPPEVQNFFEKARSGIKEFAFRGSLYVRHYKSGIDYDELCSVEVPLDRFSRYDDIQPSFIQEGHIGIYLHWFESLVGQTVRTEEVLRKAHKGVRGYFIDFIPPKLSRSSLTQLFLFKPEPECTTVCRLANVNLEGKLNDYVAGK